MQNTPLTIMPPKALTATETATGVDVSAFHGLVDFVLSSSATGGADHTSTVKLQHSDTQGSGYADAGYAFTAVTNAGASTQQITVNVDQLKKYVRGVATLAGTSPTVTSAVVMLGHRNYP